MSKKGNGVGAGIISKFESDIEIVGDVSFSGELHLQGRINGNVVAPGESTAALYVQPRSEVVGEIRAPNLVIAGKVSGDIFSTRRLTVKANAEVVGNIHYSEMLIEEGASINGTLVALGRLDENI